MCTYLHGHIIAVWNIVVHCVHFTWAHWHTLSHSGPSIAQSATPRLPPASPLSHSLYFSPHCLRQACSSHCKWKQKGRHCLPSSHCSMHFLLQQQTFLTFGSKLRHLLWRCASTTTVVVRWANLDVAIVNICRCDYQLWKKMPHFWEKLDAATKRCTRNFLSCQMSLAALFVCPNFSFSLYVLPFSLFLSFFPHFLMMTMMMLL